MVLLITLVMSFEAKGALSLIRNWFYHVYGYVFEYISVVTFFFT